VVWKNTDRRKILLYIHLYVDLSVPIVFNFCCREHMSVTVVAYTMTFGVGFSCVLTICLVICPENYPRILIIFVFLTLSPWLTLRDLLVWF
jgi:hypothetical protein